MFGQSSRAVMGVVVALVVATLACNLTKDDSAGDSVLTGSNTPPTVAIRNNPTVGAVGQPLTIEVEAVDPTGQGVTRIELKVNDRTVDQKSSPDPNGTTPLVVNLTWTPVRIGNVSMQVVAWRGSVASVPATMALTVGSTLPTGTAASSGSGTNFTPVAPTLGPCRARVDTDALNFRSIPDASSPDYIIDRFALNEEPLVLGRLADNSWYQVRDTTSTQIGWVSAGYVTLLGSCASVPVQAPPATSTPAPTNTPAPSASPAPADLVALPIGGAVVVNLDESGTATEDYSLQIQNIGASNSGAFQVQIVLPGGSEIIQDVTNLVPGGTLNVAQAAYQSITFTAPGTQQISIFVDLNNSVAESNEANNIAQLDITVNPAPETTTE